MGNYTVEQDSVYVSIHSTNDTKKAYGRTGHYEVRVGLVAATMGRS